MSFDVILSEKDTKVNIDYNPVVNLYLKYFHFAKKRKKNIYISVLINTNMQTF